MEKTNVIPKRWSVTVGEFSQERSAIDRAEMCKRNGIMAEVRDLGNNDLGNLTAAVLLIAETIKELNAKVDALTGRLPAAGTREPETFPAAGNVSPPGGHLPKLLRTAREQLGLKQEDAGRKVDINCTTVSKWETGVKTPPKATALGYCAALGIPWEAVLDAARKDGIAW